MEEKGGFQGSLGDTSGEMSHPLGGGVVYSDPLDEG